jgi:putative addiction module killer protein
VEILAYVAADGRVPFDAWFESLDGAAAARINTALTRLSLGNVSNVKGLGGSVHELRVDFGPGYRLYFGRDGDMVVILLAGGTKQRQQQDIDAAKARWQDYKKRKG